MAAVERGGGFGQDRAEIERFPEDFMFQLT
jgi:hypothetical protein